MHSFKKIAGHEQKTSFAAKQPSIEEPTVCMPSTARGKLMVLCFPVPYEVCFLVQHASNYAATLK